jgi:hypothetical protein
MPGMKREQRDFNLLPKKETEIVIDCTRTRASRTRSLSLTISLTEKICQGELQLSQGIIDTQTFGLSGTLLTAFHIDWTDHRFLGTNLYLILTIEHHSKRF